VSRHMPSLGGAEWLNSEPLISAGRWVSGPGEPLKLFLEPGTEAYSFTFG